MFNLILRFLLIFEVRWDWIVLRWIPFHPLRITRVIFFSVCLARKQAAWVLTPPLCCWVQLNELPRFCFFVCVLSWIIIRIVWRPQSFPVNLASCLQNTHRTGQCLLIWFTYCWAGQHPRHATLPLLCVNTTLCLWINTMPCRAVLCKGVLIILLVPVLCKSLSSLSFYWEPLLGTEPLHWHPRGTRVVPD